MNTIKDILPKIDFEKINAELFDSTANQSAAAISEVEEQVNKITQLRRFYDEIVMWNDKLQKNEDKYPEYIPFIKMLNAKVAYARGRKHVDDNYKDLMERCIAQLDNNNVQTFFHFKLFMEAFMGFYKAHSLIVEKHNATK